MCEFSLSLLGCIHRVSVLCVRGGSGRTLAGRFKLLSVNVTLRYLDSNYTCQLSLSPHLSPSVSACIFKPVARSASLCSTRLCAHSSPFFFASVASRRVSQYYRLCDFSSSLLRVHRGFNPLPSVLHYAQSLCESNSRQISNMEKGKQEMNIADAHGGYRTVEICPFRKFIDFGSELLRIRKLCVQPKLHPVSNEMASYDCRGNL